MISAILRGVEQKSIISLSVSLNLVTDLVTYSSSVTKLSDKEGLSRPCHSEHSEESLKQPPNEKIIVFLDYSEILISNRLSIQLFHFFVIFVV